MKLMTCVLLRLLLNLAHVSAREVDVNHFFDIYGRRLLGDEDDNPSLYRRGITSTWPGTGYPAYEAQLRHYEADAKIHMEARNEQVGQYKDYNTQYTETAHENLQTMTASAAREPDKTDKSVKPPDKTDNSITTPNKISSQFLHFAGRPQIAEEQTQVPLVSRSAIGTTGATAKEVLLSQRDSRMFLKDRSIEPMDDGIIAEMLANPAL